MKKETLYSMVECYELPKDGFSEGERLFVHQMASGGHMRNYKDSFAVARKAARLDKRILFVIIYNEKTQIILKRKWLVG